MHLLPIYDKDKLVDGSYIHAMPYCLKNCVNQECVMFYTRIHAAPTGFYQCPHGMSVYVLNSDTSHHIFSCLRTHGTYNKHLAKVTQSPTKIYNPVLAAEEIEALAATDISLQTEKQTLSHTATEINDLLHETRKLNGQIKNICDLFWDANASDSDYNVEELLSALRSIHVCSYMVYNRFQYLDAMINPGLSLGDPSKAVIFKKFDKMRLLLRGFQRKNVWISLDTPSTFSYNVYPTFETLLFILLENGIKYSPTGKPINVNFQEIGCHQLIVTISSIGPYCSQEEIQQLGTKGFRGENAILLDSTGQGIGLNFARNICAMHNIDINFSSRYSHKDHGVKYGFFTITLNFDSTKL